MTFACSDTPAKAAGTAGTSGATAAGEVARSLAPAAGQEINVRFGSRVAARQPLMPTTVEDQAPQQAGLGFQEIDMNCHFVESGGCMMGRVSSSGRAGCGMTPSRPCSGCHVHLPSAHWENPLVSTYCEPTTQRDLLNSFLYHLSTHKQADLQTHSFAGSAVMMDALCLLQPGRLLHTSCSYCARCKRRWVAAHSEAARSCRACNSGDLLTAAAGMEPLPPPFVATGGWCTSEPDAAVPAAASMA